TRLEHGLRGRTSPPPAQHKKGRPKKYAGAAYNQNISISVTAPQLTMTVPIRFRSRPARIIDWIFRWPVANTMALGGVATGIMNAQLAAMAPGTVINRGFMSSDTASAPSKGRKAAAVAVLEVTS